MEHPPRKESVRLPYCGLPAPLRPKGPALPRPSAPFSRPSRATEHHLPRPPGSVRLFGPRSRAKQSRRDPERNPTVGRLGSVEDPSPRAGELPAWSEGSANTKHWRTSTRSSAARGGVAQRVRILSPHKRSNLVLGRLRHPTLPARSACPTGAFALRLPGAPGPSLPPSANQISMSWIPGRGWGRGGQGRGRGGGGGNPKQEDDAQGPLRTLDGRGPRGGGRLACSYKAVRDQTTGQEGPGPASSSVR